MMGDSGPTEEREPPAAMPPPEVDEAGAGAGAGAAAGGGPSAQAAIAAPVPAPPSPARPRPRPTLESRLADLVAYRDRHGHASVPPPPGVGGGHGTPAAPVPAGAGLARWCQGMRQRRAALDGARAEGAEAALDGGAGEGAGGARGPPGDPACHPSGPAAAAEAEHAAAELITLQQDGSGTAASANLGPRRQGQAPGRPLLEPGVVSRMDALGFDWSTGGGPGVRYARWEDRYQQLCDFIEEYGHSNVAGELEEGLGEGGGGGGEEAAGNVCYDGYGGAGYDGLASWAKVQRTRLGRYKQQPRDGPVRVPGKKEEERIKRLDAIHFAWGGFETRARMRSSGDGAGGGTNEVPTQARPPRVASLHFEARLDQLRAYRAQFGDVNVPKRYRGDPSLGAWCHERRKLWKRLRKHPGRISRGLTPDMVSRLNELGFVWEYDPKASRDAWADRFRNLIQYRASNGGDPCVPRHYRNNPRLSVWFEEQLVQYRKYEKGEASKLSHAQYEQLARIGFGAPPSWAGMIDELKNYKIIHGDADVPPDYVTERGKLGAWVERQREQYRDKLAGVACSLTDEQIQCLKDIGFLWQGRANNEGDNDPATVDQLWKEHYEELRAYKESHGNCLVPAIVPEGGASASSNTSLGRWVALQRTAYTRLQKGESSSQGLTMERVAKLETLGFNWAPKKSSRYVTTFDERLGQLRRYRQAHGHVRVPRREIGLGEWCHTLRKNYRKFRAGKAKRSTLTKDRVDALEQLGFDFDPKLKGRNPLVVPAAECNSKAWGNTHQSSAIATNVANIDAEEAVAVAIARVTAGGGGVNSGALSLLPTWNAEV